MLQHHVPIMADSLHRVKAKLSGSATPTKQQCPLLCLPEKVRIIIYAYTMTYRAPLPIRKHCSNSAWFDGREERLISKSWRFTPPLLRTCHQVQEEADPIFYASNAFSATIRNTGDVAEIMSWLEETNAFYLTLVKQVVLNIEPMSFADLLDMGTNKEVFSTGRLLGEALVGAGIPTDRVKILEPEMKYLDKDGLLMRFDYDDAQRIRRRWVNALEVEMREEEDELAQRLKGLMTGTTEESRSDEKARGGLGMS